MMAVYITGNQFTVEGDLTAEFLAGRRIKADCGVDGIKYSTIQTSSYSSPNTTVTIAESVLTSNLTDVLYGIINTGAEGSLPDHAHDGTEGNGGQISYTDLSDLPSAPTTFSGTTVFTEELFVDGDTTVTGTVYAHIYDSYSPLTIKDGGVSVLIGDGAGNIDFPNGLTVSGAPVVGLQGEQGETGGQGPMGVMGAPGIFWLNGFGTPSSTNGEAFDYYLDGTTGDIYTKDDGVASSNLLTDQDACSSSAGTAKNVIIGGSQWNMWDPTPPVWWQYDFGASNTNIVTSVTLKQGWGGYTFGSGYIYGSNDGETYYLLHYFNNGDVGGQTDTMVFANRTPYRYIKIQHPGSPLTPGIETLSMSYFTDVDWQSSGVNIMGPQGPTGLTASGTTSSGGASTFLELTDTPATYSGIDGNYFRATASGIEAVDGIILKASDESEWRIRVTTSGVLYTEAI
jgi:hypothetical protein